MDDAELVRQVLLGNLGAFADLVTRFTAQIAVICRLQLPRSADVDDLVAETFFRALNGIANLREPTCFGSWLYAIARNLCRDWHNDRHHDHVSLELECETAAPDPATFIERQDRVSAIRRCVEKLRPDYREIVELYYSGGRMTYQQLADRLGISVAKVGQMLARARRLLRVCMERS